MVLIIGGAYQGKLAFAMEKFGIAESDPVLVKDYHLKVLDQIRNGLDPLKDLQGQIYSWRAKLIICDDIFCGVVPEDPQLRLWRETLGRCLVCLSAEADEVYRVFCGLGVKIKSINENHSCE